ncbi:MAG: ABC transporter permease, partial [Thermodesulfovibrionales bacterium]
MKPVRIKAIAKKELLQIRRDPLSLAMAFLMPVMLLFIFGYAISLDVDNLRTVVYDRDKSGMSRELIREVSASGYFTLVDTIHAGTAIDRYLDSGKAHLVLSIPENFSREIRSGRTPSLQVIVDGSDSNTATIALGYVTAVTERCAQRVG